MQLLLVTVLNLKLNDSAPLFESVSDEGQKFSLSDLIGRTNIVLYFYPKDFTTGCTKEACSFRDSWSKILSLGATVVGISSDSPERHREFKQKHGLQFVLLSDQNRSIRKLYGVDNRLFPPRATFVIDKHGKLVSIFNSQLNITKHVQIALDALQNIESEVST